MNIIVWDSGVTQPEDKGILLKDIIENGEVEKCHTLSNTALNRIDRKTGYKPQIMPDKTGTLNTKNNSGQLSIIDNGTTLIPVVTGGAFRGRNPENTSDRTPGATTEQRLEINETGKSNALTSVSKDSLVVNADNITWRKLTPIECERLQTIQDNYTNHVSNSQRYKMLGNGWTVDVTVHIFSFLKESIT